MLSLRAGTQPTTTGVGTVRLQVAFSPRVCEPRAAGRGHIDRAWRRKRNKQFAGFHKGDAKRIELLLCPEGLAQVHLGSGDGWYVSPGGMSAGVVVLACGHSADDHGGRHSTL